MFKALSLSFMAFFFLSTTHAINIMNDKNIKGVSCHINSRFVFTKSNGSSQKIPFNSKNRFTIISHGSSWAKIRYQGANRHIPRSRLSGCLRSNNRRQTQAGTNIQCSGHNCSRRPTRQQRLPLTAVHGQTCYIKTNYVNVQRNGKTIREKLSQRNLPVKIVHRHRNNTITFNLQSNGKPGWLPSNQIRCPQAQSQRVPARPQNTHLKKEKQTFRARDYFYRPLNKLVITDRIRFREKHPVTGKARWHLGYDYARTSPNQKVRASAAGSAVCKIQKCKTGPNKGKPKCGYGYYIEIRHQRPPGFKTVYAHIKRNSRLCLPGTIGRSVWVKNQQHIATIGNTGGGTGPHLHYEIVGPGKKYYNLHNNRVHVRR